MQRSRSVINNEKRFTSIPAEGGEDDSWGDLLLRQPVKDDGRRQRSTTSVPSGSELTTPVGYPNRWIVGPGVGGDWSSLIGQLVTWSGSAWVAEEQRVGQLVYSYKRDEYLELVDTIQNSIAPTLTPAIMVSAAGGVLRFWMPQSLLDSYQTAYKGTVKSLTTQSGSWTTLCYDRYVIRADDTTYSAYAGYIATYVADILTNSGKWVFQPAKEGDFVYSEGDNNFYYHNGTTWVVFSGGTGVAALYAAEGRAGSSATATMTLTASASGTFQKIAFPYSAVLDLAVCPPSFFADGGNDFEAPRTGHYAVGFAGFYTEREPGTVDQVLTVVVRVNGTTIPSGTFTIPNIDNYEGEGFKCILKLNAGDLVTLEFKCAGADWANDITVHNGFNFFIHTIDAVGNEAGEHALNDHTDTNFPSPADGDTIVWDAGTSKWVNSAAPPPGAHTLGSHSDTTFASLTTNDVVTWDGSAWVNGPVAAGPHTIIGSSHSDTLINGTLTDNQALIYESATSKWRNKPIPVPALDNLSNVTMTSKTAGDFLWWTGSTWANRAIRLDDLFDVLAPAPATNQVLYFNGSNWVAGNPTLSATVSFAGGCWEWAGGGWSNTGGGQVGCSTSGISFVAGSAGFWQAIVTVSQTAAAPAAVFAWRQNGVPIGTTFGPSAAHPSPMTFSATFGLAAGGSMDLNVVSGIGIVSYMRATFTKVGS